MQHSIDSFPQFFHALMAESPASEFSPDTYVEYPTDEQLVCQIRLLHQTGAPDLALKYAIQALHFIPGSHALGCLFFEFASASILSQQAEWHWEPLLAKCSRNGYVMAAHALYMQKHNRLRAAQATFAKALPCGVRSRLVYKYYMLFLHANNLHTELKMLLESYISKFKKIDLTYYLGSARAYLGMHNTKKALVYVQNGLRDYPNNPDLLICLAEFHLQNSDKRMAIFTIKAAHREMLQTDEIHQQSLLSYSETEYLELAMEILARVGRWREAMLKAARLHELMPQQTKYSAAIEAIYRLTNSHTESKNLHSQDIVGLLALAYCCRWTAAGFS
jgi:predicted Zn-dependent protease